MFRKNYRDIQAYEVIQFTYAGGSTPGSLRTLAVKDTPGTYDGNIGGFDFQRKAYRQFKGRDMTNPIVVEQQDGAFVVDMNFIPTKVNQAEFLLAYEEDGNIVHLDGHSLYVVKEEIVNPKTMTAEFDSYGQLLIRNTTGRTMVNICKSDSNSKNGEVHIYRCDKSTIYKATPQDILDALKEVV